MRTRAFITSLLLLTAPIVSTAAGQSTALAQPAVQPAAPQPTQEQVKQATAHFMKGNELFAAKKFELALAEFKASYAAVPSPNSLLYVARSLEQLGQRRAAHAEFGKVVEQAEARAAAEPKYAPTAASARSEQAELAAKLAWLTVHVRGASESATLRVGSDVIAREAWQQPLAVDPGEVTLVVDAPPNPSVSQTITVQAGDKRDVELDASPKLAAAPPAAPPESAPAASTNSASTLRTAAFVAGGVGVVGLGLFIGAGASANGTYSDLEDACGSRPCPASRQGDIDSGRSMQTLANVGLVVGGVGLGSGVVLFLLSRRSPKAAEAVASHVVVAPGYGGVRGTF